VRCYVAAAILGTCSIALDPANAASFQQSKVFRASATVAIVPGKPEVVVRLRNASSVPLEAWELRIEYDVAGGPRKTIHPVIETATDEAEPGTPGRGAILPGEARDVPYAVDGEPLSAAVVIELLLFEDGTVEGDTGLAKMLFVQRDRDAEALGVWIGVFDAASRVPVQQARTVLETALASEARRMKATPANATAQSASERVMWLLGSPDDVLQTRIAAIKKTYERVYERETRHRPRR
jgi:hypothetical protein